MTAFYEPSKTRFSLAEYRAIDFMLRLHEVGFSFVPLLSFTHFHPFHPLHCLHSSATMHSPNLPFNVQFTLL